MHDTVRSIRHEPVPSQSMGRQLAEPNAVTILRYSMLNSLRRSHDYEIHPEIPPNERTVEFTADVITTLQECYIFDHVLWDAGWQYWEKQVHHSLGRTTYKLWLYPDERIVILFNGAVTSHS